MTIVLEDGNCWSGMGNGGFASGEVVFTTASSGYPQAISDPSFAGQIIVFAFPMVGNYGVDEDLLESNRPWARAVLSGSVEAGDSLGPRLEEWLAGYEIPLVTGVDTWSLVRHIRTRGALQGAVAPAGEKTVFETTDVHPVEEVSVAVPEVTEGTGKTIVVIDYGLKHGIKRELVKKGCRVVRLPHDSSKDEILSWCPDGILMGNGPGDPSLLEKQIKVASSLAGEVPVGGICLGLQIMALACGASTYKLPFGHRGENHAVIDLRSGRGLVTSQNHGYAVSENSLEGTGLEVTHRNLADGSVEGVRSVERQVLAVQYHPEGSPGPADGEVFFEEFLSMCERSSSR